MQWVSNSWSSPMGSMAIMVLIAFFNAQEGPFGTDIYRQEWAARYLENLHFVYKDAEGNDKKVCVKQSLHYLLTSFLEF